ncbi:hypothetical protein N7G274_006636 [Stereocaulon virgatum]|uniref:Rrp15p-domain-containing protein n=1 Tax=Stereocaulon virgatum TaxID=373712 RepID=A0ABR4A423_9LECA
MAPSNLKKRKLDNENITNPTKIRKQQHYSSPSASSSENEDEIPAVNLADLDNDADTGSEASPPINKNRASEEASSSSAFDSDSDSDSSADSHTSQPSNPNNTKLSKQKSKRNDPDAFASSMSAILTSKLNTQKRIDPVLARSATAHEASLSVANTKLEAKARHKLHQDKKEALEKGRVKDVLGVESGEAQGVIEEEKRLRKIAQRGVVKLFNAVRQAQVRGEEARKTAVDVKGRARREEKVGEMSRGGFLEMVAGGGKQGRIEEG